MKHPIVTKISLGSDMSPNIVITVEGEDIGLPIAIPDRATYHAMNPNLNRALRTVYEKGYAAGQAALRAALRAAIRKLFGEGVNNTESGGFLEEPVREEVSKGKPFKTFIVAGPSEYKTVLLEAIAEKQGRALEELNQKLQRLREAMEKRHWEAIRAVDGGEMEVYCGHIPQDLSEHLNLFSLA